MKKILICLLVFITSATVYAENISCKSSDNKYSISIAKSDGSGEITTPHGNVTFSRSVSTKGTVYASNEISGIAKNYTLNIKTGFLTIILKESISGRPFLQANLTCKSQ